jgi:hypothetical protein
MAEPITAAALAKLSEGIATLLVTELTKNSAGEAGKKLVGELWGAIAKRFQGNPAAETLELVKAEPSAGAARDLETFLRREMRDGAKLILFSTWQAHLQNSSVVQKLYNTINKPNRFTNLSPSISELNSAKGRSLNFRSDRVYLGGVGSCWGWRLYWRSRGY